MRFSVCVPTHDRPGSLAACLHAIVSLDPAGQPLEVVVADDASVDAGAIEEVVEGAAASAPHITFRFVRRRTNGGAAAARNAAWRSATGDWIAFTDDDCRPRPGWLASMQETIEAASAAGAQVDVVQGRTVPDPVRSHLLGRPYVRSLRIESSSELLQTCNVAYRRTLLEDLGGFDESFRGSGEDTDLGCRARAAGAVLAFAPDAVVEHEVAEHDWRWEVASRRRWADVPFVVARHPELRRLAWRSLVYRRSHVVPLLFGVTLPLLLTRRGRRTWIAALSAMLASDVVRAGSPAMATAALATRAGDAYETALVTRASARARTVLL